jgi:hypothetical protein
MPNQLIKKAGVSAVFLAVLGLHFMAQAQIVAPKTYQNRGEIFKWATSQFHYIGDTTNLVDRGHEVLVLVGNTGFGLYLQTVYVFLRQADQPAGPWELFRADRLPSSGTTKAMVEIDHAARKLVAKSAGDGVCWTLPLDSLKTSN